MARGRRDRFGRVRPGWRLLAGLVFELASTAVVLGVPGLWIWRHLDLAPWAAVQASASLGRAVRVGGLRIGLDSPASGRTVTVEIRDVGIANLPGGSGPDLVAVRHARAVVGLGSVLHGPLLVHRAEVEGLDVRLERTPEGIKNWKFGPQVPPPADRQTDEDSTGRRGYASLRDVAVRDSRVVFHTSAGKDLVTALDQASIRTGADDQPVKLSIKGGYNGVALDLDADLQSIDALRDVARPYGTVLNLQAPAPGGALTLVFDGTMTDPLGFDGLDGRLQLDGPDSTPLLRAAGVSGGPDVQVHLDGAFTHKALEWRLADAAGQLGQDEVEHATLGYREGPRGKPDHLELALAFGTLDLDALLDGGKGGKRGAADMPLPVAREPDTLIKAEIRARAASYTGLQASGVLLRGAVEEGEAKIDALDLTLSGAAVRGRGRVVVGEGVGDVPARVEATLSVAGADVQMLRRELGFGSLPLAGRLDGEVSVEAVARTVNTAVRGAKVGAVIAMRGGSVSRQVIEMASTDVRALFRTDRGMVPLQCALAGLEMRAGVGTLAPLRVRAADGVILGSASFDLNRKTFDLTIGSEAKTTGLLALDIPVRVSGSFDAPLITPAQWSREGRAALAAAEGMGGLPQGLRDWARRYPCPASR